jgi:hypothetical protein
MSFRYSAVAILAGIAILLAFVLTKSLLVGQYWFHGIEHWPVLFRSYPAWGNDAERYGALLPSKWIGTRSLGAAIGMFAALVTGFSVRAYRLAALVACEAASIELLDALWLAIGKHQGWITAATNRTMVTDLCWAVLLLAAAWLLWGRDEPAPGRRPAIAAVSLTSLAIFLDRYFIYLCYAVALVYAGMKLLFAYWWWFDSIGFWLAAFRPFPDWGIGADLFGALLPARMIGSRNLAFGLFILFALWYALRRHDHRLLAILLLQGAVIELFDGFWLANGKYNMLWIGQNTDFFMKGGFIWVADLMLAGVYILSRDRPHQSAELVI